MNKILKDFLSDLYNNAVILNHENIFNLFREKQDAKFLDLGCDDGSFTLNMAKYIRTNDIFGVDIVDERIDIAKSRGIIVKKFDLNNKFEFDDNFFDVVSANQVIEHIYNSDNFISEIYRILKVGGYAIISTENASSWCNIFASIMGWQIFSLTNFSNKKLGIGNPFALHRDNSSMNFDSWAHVRIYNIRGLKEYFELFGFEVVKISGAGYFPLPSCLGKMDIIHSHFITFKIQKIR
ncbi:MAG TPA: class I SAM-dependent methyltransferase [bacterium]|nr:class I SAM-dependent methyltransferase [bacterium]HQL12356.1 class I SAM-dependent methyltransferase [bacterium]